MDFSAPLSDPVPLSLPDDGCAGTLVGRVWDPAVGGPSPVLVLDNGVFDLSAAYATIRDLCEEKAPAAAARAAAGRRLGSISDVLSRDSALPRLLAPVDLQTLKAAGVTFAKSMVERVIEERVGGDLQAAGRMRLQILDEIGADLTEVAPGSAKAQRLKAFLTARGLWSQYLEVGIGADAEIFTKAPSLAAVGTLAAVGVPSSSTWNNSEPEVALAISSAGLVVGAMLGNDVNLRDVEGRSALLLPQAKDNNASCALGPLLRLFDDTFSLDTVRATRVSLDVKGRDGFSLRDTSPMSQISRDPSDLVRQLFRSHDYPDGAVLMLGTPFAPIVDRDTEGLGFTHKPGDVVRISAPALGGLINEVKACDDCPSWSYGMRELMGNLASRGLLREEAT